jgi:hypothetical protein
MSAVAALALLAWLDVTDSPSPDPKHWRPPELPLVWERVAPAPQLDTPAFLNKFLPSDRTLGSTCALTNSSTARTDPSFSSPSETQCGILRSMFQASLPADPKLAGSANSCGLAVYREGSEQLAVGIFHFLAEGDASRMEAQLENHRVPFVARRRSTLVWSLANAHSKCAALVMEHVRQLP